jgi:hypothetical protein
MSDDFTGEYMNSRGQQSTPFDDIEAQVRGEQLEDAPDSSTNDFLNSTGSQPIGEGILDTAGDVVGDIAGGIIEAPRQIIGGVMDATKELAQFMESVVPLGTVGGGEVTEDSFITTDEARTTTGALTRGVSQFVAGFLPALKGIKALGVTSKVAQVAGAGAVADALVFDPHEARLSDLIESNPSLSNPVTRYLESDPTDSDAEGRFKNAVEGLGLGGALDGFVKAVKLLRANRIEKNAARKLVTDRETASKLAGDDAAPSLELEPTPVFDADAGEFIPFEEKPLKKRLLVNLLSSEWVLVRLLVVMLRILT